MSQPQPPRRSLELSESLIPPNSDTRRPSDSVPQNLGAFATMPTKFGRYQVEKLLGRGAMGSVYLARDLQLGRRVALKIPRVSAAGSKRLLQRLETEAKAAASLDHPSLCKVFDAGEIDGHCYLALQYIEGETLKSQLDGPGKTVQEAVSLIIQLAEGLAEAHAIGIIHRDIKPENIMINRRGVPVIMDFGLAKISTITSNAAATQAGTILGSPAYMSPEQASGELNTIDRRSDIYALGVVLFELLTGELPFQGSAMQILGQKSLLDPESPINRNPELPFEVAEICHRMISKQILDRQNDLHEVIAELRALDLSATKSQPKSRPKTNSPSLSGFNDFSLSRRSSNRSRLRGNSESAPKTAGLGSLWRWWTELPPVTKLMAFSGGAALLIALGVIVLFPTRHGIVQIEIDDPAVSVRFNGSTVTIDNDGEEIKVNPNSRNRLEVLHGGVAIESASQELTLRRGEKRLVTITLVGDSLIVDGRRKGTVPVATVPLARDPVAVAEPAPIPTPTTTVVQSPPTATATAPTAPAETRRVSLRQEGFNGFPQQAARVVCDNPDLRFSICSDDKYLFVQAILWNDGDDQLGRTGDGRLIGDRSELLVDVDGDQKATPHVDRNYMLNPWPAFQGLHYVGLHYVVVQSDSGTTGILADSKGRGAIQYVNDAAGARTRVESYVIPLDEIKRAPGDTIRVAYWAQSQAPAMTVNSVGHTSQGHYYSYSIPKKTFHDVTLGECKTVLDPQLVPDARHTPRPPVVDAPLLGTMPPEVKAADWLNTDRPWTLATLKGQVVLVDFWATWCVACVDNISHLNALQKTHGAKGLKVLSFTDQDRQEIEAFQKRTMTPIEYTIGVGSKLSETYGVTGIPHAFLIGRDGTLLWHGSPASPECEHRIAAAIAGTPYVAPAVAAPSPVPAPSPEAANIEPEKAIAQFHFTDEVVNDAFGNGRATASLKNTEFRDKSLYLNGKYEHNGKMDGYRAEFATPALDFNTFSVVVRFKAQEFTSGKSNILTGGGGYRWFGLRRSPAGNLAVTLNNGNVYKEIKFAKLQEKRWYVAASTVDLKSGEVTTYLNGKKVDVLQLPKDFKLEVVGTPREQYDKNWFFVDYSNGNVFHGLVSNLAVYRKILTADDIKGFEVNPKAQ